MSEFQQFVDLVTKGGLPLVIAAIVVGGWRRWYVWGWTLDQIVKDKDAQITALRADRDEWKTLANRATADTKLMVEWAQGVARGARP